MTARTVALLDTAIGSVKQARDHLRHDDRIEPADLSAVIGTIRELTWTIDTYTSVLADRYVGLDDLGHDDGHDPVLVVAHITERLTRSRGCLDTIDGLLGDAHNHAARLHHAD